MATSDIEVSVRVAVIQILRALDALGELEEDQSEALCLLVFDHEPRVRKAISTFIQGIWSADIDERLVGRRTTGSEKGKERTKVGIKSLAGLLVKWAKALEKDAEGDAAIDQEESQEGGSDAGVGYKSKEVSALVAESQRGRIAQCVESLWDELDATKDWEVMLDLLLLDHSAEDAEVLASPVASKRKKASSSKNRKNATVSDGDEGRDQVDDAWRLSEPEEAVLVEVLVASMKKTITDALAQKKSVSIAGFIAIRVSHILIIFRAGRGRDSSNRHHQSINQSASKTLHQAPG